MGMGDVIQKDEGALPPHPYGGITSLLILFIFSDIKVVRVTHYFPLLPNHFWEEWKILFFFVWGHMGIIIERTHNE